MYGVPIAPPAFLPRINISIEKRRSRQEQSFTNVQTGFSLQLSEWHKGSGIHVLGWATGVERFKGALRHIRFLVSGMLVDRLRPKNVKAVTLIRNGRGKKMLRRRDLSGARTPH
jgi:hypothetical protein